MLLNHVLVMLLLLLIQNISRALNKLKFNKKCFKLMTLIKMMLLHGENLILEIHHLRKNYHMLEQFLDSLIKIMIGKLQRNNLQELKLNNLLHILEVEEKEENDQP